MVVFASALIYAMLLCCPLKVIFFFQTKKIEKDEKKNLFIIHATKVEGSFEFFVVMINYFFHYYGPV